MAAVEIARGVYLSIGTANQDAVEISQHVDTTGASKVTVMLTVTALSAATTSSSLTLTGQVQGTNDRATNWTDITDILVSATAVGTFQDAGDIGGYAYVRVLWKLADATALIGSYVIFSATLNLGL